MNAREKMAAEEQRLELFRAARWTCVVCQEPLNRQGVAQLAHRVPKKDSLIQRWGREVIHHPLNLVPVCGLECNSKVNMGTISEASKALLARIVRINTGREPMPNLEDHYDELREQFKTCK